MLCLHEWKPIDPRQPGLCPSCGQYEFDRIRCAPQDDWKGCYLDKLDEELLNNTDGDVIAGIKEIESQLALQLHVSPFDIRADVYLGLLILQEERDRYNKENPQR